MKGSLSYEEFLAVKDTMPPEDEIKVYVHKPKPRATPQDRAEWFAKAKADWEIWQTTPLLKSVIYQHAK